jgi:hypothetical protein
MDAARVVDITITGMVSKSGSRDQPLQTGVDNEVYLGLGVATNRGEAPVQLFFSAGGDSDSPSKAGIVFKAKSDVLFHARGAGKPGT